MSKAIVRLKAAETRLAALALFSDNAIRTALVNTEDYEERVEAASGQNLDGVCVLLIYVGASNPEPRVRDAAHVLLNFQIEIWKDPAKHNPDIDPTFDEIEESIVAALHGWAAPDSPLSQKHLQQFIWTESLFLGEVVNQDGETEFLRYALTFQSRAVVALTP